ncbi:MAG: thiamine pyrophosphate-binding protein [Woeseiaceae bacterium]|nr:thiamine pyrophosphate-binding protein [Woeseiaceae bacterium]
MATDGDSDGRAAKISRRHFLGTTAGAATLIGGRAAAAQESPPAGVDVPAPSPGQLRRDLDATPPPATAEAVDTPGSDRIVELLRELDIEFVTSNPASSFEGIWESIVNTGDPPNTRPEFITALHEEAAVDMAHGYAKSEGRPIAAMLHGTIGLMHASMAIYQAFHSQTPVLILVGRDDTNFVRAQSANDIAGIVRSYTKWDAHPASLQETLDAIAEAYRQAVTPPMGPTVVVIDAELQKRDAGEARLPRIEAPAIPTISRRDAEAIGGALVDANQPRLDVGRLRTPAGIERTVELAELVGASVESQAWIDPMSFPQGHPLAGPGLAGDHDYILGLERGSPHASIIGPHRRSFADRDVTGIGYGFVREPPVPIWGPYAPPKPGANDLTADAEDSLPLIIAAVRERLSPERAEAIRQRIDRIAEANATARLANLEREVAKRRRGWNGRPVATVRLFAELYPLIRDDDWCLASPTQFTGQHNRALWEHNKPYSALGQAGAGGMGYILGASVGAALAARDRGRIVINIQPDGDLNYVPASLWTAAHYRLPLLTIMHNNRAYHQEFMYAQHLTAARRRGIDRAHTGLTFRDPFIDYSALAKAYGVETEAPIEDPELLRPALERGVAAVKSGRPYLVDVITQPR